MGIEKGDIFLSKKVVSFSLKLELLLVFEVGEGVYGFFFVLFGGLLE